MPETFMQLFKHMTEIAFTDQFCDIHTVCLCGNGSLVENPIALTPRNRYQFVMKKKYRENENV